MKSIIWIALFLLSSNADEDNTFTHNQMIRKKLLNGYDKNVRPQKWNNGTTRVYVQMYPRATEINEAKEHLIVDSWIVLLWFDDRLVWDRKDFGGTRKALFGDGELWKPDLTVYNNAEISEFDHYANTHFHAMYYGGVYWIPPCKTVSHCKLDLTDWPYDTQACTVEMGSWTSHGWEIDFNFFRNTTEIPLYWHLNISSQWKVLKAEKQLKVTLYSYSDIPYQEVLFSFLLKRVSPSFAPVMVVPAAMLPLLLLIQFILPVDHPKRITIGCFCAILVMMEMLFIKLVIPKVGTTTPLIVSYYSLAFVIVVITVALSAVLSRISHPQNPLLAFPPGEYVKLILTGPLAMILCLQDHAGKVGLSNRLAEDGEVLDSSTKSPSFAHEWLLVAKAVDRIAFIIFLFIFIIALIAYTA